MFTRENGEINFKKTARKINSPEQNIKYFVTRSEKHPNMNEKWLFFESSTK